MKNNPRPHEKELLKFELLNSDNESFYVAQRIPLLHIFITL